MSVYLQKASWIQDFDWTQFQTVEVHLQSPEVLPHGQPMEHMPLPGDAKQRNELYQLQCI